MSALHDLAKGFTMHSAETLCKDASFVPSESLDWKPMEHGKSVNEILSECAKGNMALAAAVRGEDPKDMDTSVDFDALKGCVMASAKEVCDAIDSLSDEDLGKEAQMPWGQIFPMAAAIMLPTSHMNYHDGQINYIQLLLGDLKFHWME